ncbi:MAG: hypothetical protein IPG96_13795 [Proteobacteria bacterium]|nr:hypothetical protein [Pseudomonadota bacterium]
MKRDQKGARRQLVGLLTLLAAAGTPRPAARAGEPANAEELRHRSYSTELRPYTRKVYPDHGLADTLTPLGRAARGFYLTAAYLYRVGAERASGVMQDALMNAVVIDVKDDWGQVLWPSLVPLTRGVQWPLMRDPRAIVEAFHRRGIYVIARIVCFKDSRLPYVRPDLSVRFQPHGRRLFRAGAGWIDQWSAEAQDYIIDLAREWESFGVDEIQLDYIRFPKGNAGKVGLWLHQAGDARTRSQLITGFLERIDRALRVPLSVDIYGLTTLVDGDPRELGQTVETMSRYVEAISPMMYANGMTTYFRDQTISEWVYDFIQCGLWRARLKMPPSVVLRPFLQSYPNNVPFFGGDFIKRQVLAARAAGAEGFLFWNSTMLNKTAYRALRELGRRELDALAARPGWSDAATIAAAVKQPGAWCKRPGEGAVFGVPMAR